MRENRGTATHPAANPWHCHTSGVCGANAAANPWHCHTSRAKRAGRCVRQALVGMPASRIVGSANR